GPNRSTNASARALFACDDRSHVAAATDVARPGSHIGAADRGLRLVEAALAEGVGGAARGAGLGVVGIDFNLPCRNRQILVGPASRPSADSQDRRDAGPTARPGFVQSNFNPQFASMPSLPRPELLRPGRRAASSAPCPLSILSRSSWRRRSSWLWRPSYAPPCCECAAICPPKA